MSDIALKLYKDAFNIQAERTEARRIRTRVGDARSATTGASARWPFELLQNVHDAGPRSGRERVSVSFSWDGASLVVEHDGTPFKLEEVAVQEVVRSCMESRGLKLTLIDHGYDYDVALPDGDVLLDGAYRLEVGSWMMEVKATTSGDVRMTPTQAGRASEEPERYLLCVVDLRGLSDVERKGPWTPAIVEPRAKIFRQIGLAVTPTRELVTEAVENEVGIRNEKVLRYSVPPSVWEAGTPLEAWVNALSSA